MSCCCSENIAHLAESALRFLELVQENNVSTELDPGGEDAEETNHPNENYDSGTDPQVLLQVLLEVLLQVLLTPPCVCDPQSCRRCMRWCSRRW